MNGEVREAPLTERQRIGGLLDSVGKQAAVLLRAAHSQPDLSLTPLLTTQLTHLGSPQTPVIRRDSPPRSADQLADLWDGLTTLSRR